MESKRRHELEKNSAEEILKSIKEFLKKNSMRIVVVILVAAMVWLGLTIHNRNKSEEELNIIRTFESCNRQMMSGNYEAEKLIEEYNTLIDQERNPRIAIIAMIELGGLFINQAGSADSANRENYFLDRAVKFYTRAISTAGDLSEYRFLKAKAYLGLATVAEERGKFADAIKECQSAIKIPGIEGSVVSRTAKQTKMRLENNKKLIKLPETQPAWIAEKIRQAEEEARRAAEAAASRPVTSTAPATATQPASAPTTEPVPTTRPATSP